MIKEEGRKRGATHRVNVNFSDDAYEALKDIARSRDKTISEVLRDAIALEQWYQDTKREGGRVIVELQDGRVREVVRP
jgi:predicted transcriptional regulator